MSSVLIIDDDKELCILMKKCVEHEGLSAIAANGGMEGLRLAEEYKTSLSLVILDVMMPDLDGFQVLQKIREVSNVPVLMLTAKSDEEDKVSGLRLGADDYLTKPFSINELMARVNSLVRRYTTLNQTTEVCTGKITLQGMTIDKNNRVVTVNGTMLELTGKEFDLLFFLATNKGRVFTKKQIYTQVWDDEYAFDDSNIMSFISKLRKKIEPDPEQPFYIQTVRGVGYTEEQLKEKGVDYKVGRFVTAANGRSLVSGHVDGMVKIIAGEKYGEILGVHIMAPSATELIEEAALAIRLEATVDELVDTIHCHPTVSEALREAALAVDGRAIHMPNKKK